MNNGNEKIIGYDQITGQPIFDTGINSPIKEESKEEKEKNVLSKGKLIFHIFLSFLVWNLIFGLGFSFLGTTLLYGLKNINTVLYLVIYNLLWLVSSLLTIFFTYWFNKYNICKEYQLRSVRKICLFMFLIGIIGINSINIKNILNYFPIVESIITVIHIILIWYFNDEMFNKWIDDIDGKF